MSALRTLAFLALVAVSSSQTSDCSYVGLLTHLNLATTNDLLATMRPVKVWTTPSLVQLDMFLYGILEVDEKSQTVTSHIWIRMWWTNEFLTWNSTDFCGINMLTVPRSRLWIPDIQIKEDTSDAGSIHKSAVVKLYPNGLMLATTRERLTSTCRMDLLLFPFDTQECTITFSSMTSEEHAVQLKLEQLNSGTVLTKVPDHLMVTKGEWELQNMTIIVLNVTKESKSKLIYKVSISRKPMLYVINLIVPLLFFLVLDLVSFSISEARGEKLSFKVTILLSISVMLLILQDILPSTEANVPMISKYCLFIFTFVGLSVLETMLVGYLYDLDGCCCKTAQSPADAQEDIQLEVDNQREPAGAEGIPDKSSLPLDGPVDGDLLKLILQEVKAARQEVEEHKDQRKTGRYRRAAVIIDRVFFFFYFLATGLFVSFMNTLWVSNIYNK
ncbi:5-hydroxytryptamine receptor 3A-like [Gymnodraco acuticeps]|uniref:5-hydroxytryptamine receptor 3A-like n=1 Tax=Gymnodraco acuticeps TaxID=8218 RepID=A0A6P8TDZ3_GYMAC|nr:5-hydroxytryptamine receptor 3A-like [Gymnodraco acuticeps]